MSANQRSALIAGATGLVGREILRGLLADETVRTVHALGRKPPAQQHSKLIFHAVDFAALPALPRVDEIYLALGTTIKIAGSQAAFRAVDFDANLAVARAAATSGAKRVGLVSAMGANPLSLVFYNRVKGELEDALGDLGLHGLVIARPSFLVGDRSSLGQPLRGGEKLALRISTVLRPLIPANYRSVDSAAVARSLLQRVPTAVGRVIVPSGAMR